MSAEQAMAGPSPERKGSMGDAVRAVAWAFLGIRKNSGYQDDLGKLNPLHVIVVALVAVALLVGGLIALVNWVVR